MPQLAASATYVVPCPLIPPLSVSLQGELSNKSNVFYASGHHSTIYGQIIDSNKNVAVLIKESASHFMTVQFPSVAPIQFNYSDVHN